MFLKTIRISFYVPVILNIVILYPPQTYQAGELHNFPNISSISGNELLKISEELFNRSHQLLSFVHINYQGHTFFNFSVNAPERLLNISLNTSVPLTLLNSYIKLFDNYELDTYQQEVVTKEEEIEENEFLDNLMQTDVILYVMHFLSTKGFFEKNLHIYKSMLKDVWFGLYSRSKGVNGSSGFEHVFLGERKPRKGITGFHNWIFFAFAEMSNKVDYFGYSRSKELPGKAVILEAFFTYIGKRKMSTMFIGTPPELEIALYTLCFFARPNKRCKVSYKSFKFDIQTYRIQNNNTYFVASAFPILGKVQ